MHKKNPVHILHTHNANRLHVFNNIVSAIDPLLTEPVLTNVTCLWMMNSSLSLLMYSCVCYTQLQQWLGSQFHYFHWAVHMLHFTCIDS